MHLHIGDEYNRIVDVMNNVFGWNYKACFRGRYVVNPEKNVIAWFPKLADLDRISVKPSDKKYGWCNVLSQDGKYLYMNNYDDPGLLNKAPVDQPEPHITFAKFPGEKRYRYIGVYSRVKRDSEHGWIYERLAEDIDLDTYLI